MSSATPSPAPREWTSWNGNVRHPYQQLHQITTEAQLVQAIQQAPSTVRPFGSKQSSADIAAGTPTLLDMTHYQQILHYDEAQRQVTVQAGIPLKALLQALQAKNWTLPCLPDIDTVTLGGALATGTHGTGRSGKMLSAYMVACRLVLADGQVREVTKDDPIMPAVRVSLGVLGVFSTITLACEPLYTLALREQPMHDRFWLPNYNLLLEQYDFTRILWLPHTDHAYAILGERIAADTPFEEQAGPAYLRHRRAVSKWLYRYTTRFPRLTPFANNILQRLFFTSKKASKGSLYDATVTKSRSGTLELAEWTIGLSKFETVFRELKQALEDSNNPAFVHIPMDVRFIQQDDAWLSYAYGEDCVTVGCVTRDAAHADWYAAFEVVEAIFLKHGGRPHWGKRFSAKDTTLNRLYPKWQDFKALRAELDPTGKFLNPYLSQLFDVSSTNAASASSTLRSAV